MRYRVTFFLGLIFLFLVLVLTPGYSHAEQQTVCVTEFADLSGAEEDGWLSNFLPDCIGNNLELIPEIRIVHEKWPHIPMAENLAADADAFRLSLCAKGRSAHAQFVLGGDFRRDGDKVSVDVAFFDVGEQKQIGGASFVSSVPELYSRLDDLCASLVGALSLGYSDEQFARVRAIPTTSVEAMTLYGKALAMPPKSEERESLLFKAVAKSPRYTDALSKLGVYYYGVGKFAAAQETFEKLARIAPDSAEVCYNLGLIYRSQGNYSRAVEMYQRAVRIEPKDSDAWNNMGVVCYLMGMPEKATEAFSRAIDANADNSDARANLELVDGVAKGASQKGSHNAVGNADTASTVNKLKEYIETGAALYAAGDYSRAIQEFQKALEIQPDNFKANNNIALVYMKMGETEKAREHLRLALKADPTAIDVSERLARLQDGPRVSNAAAESSDSQPVGQPHTLCVAGEVYLSRQAYAEAAGAFSQALAASPNDLDALNGLGTTYFAMGEYEKAREQFEKTLSLDANNETARKKLDDVHYVLAAVDKKSGSDQSLGLSIPPEIEARGRLVRGNELYKAGDYEQALGEYRRALDLAPTSIEILNNLGNTYFALKRYDEAKATFQKAHNLDPDNKLIKGNLEIVEMAERAGKATEMKSLETTPQNVTPGQKEVAPAASPKDAPGPNAPGQPEKPEKKKEDESLPANSAGVDAPKGGGAGVSSRANADSESKNEPERTAKNRFTLAKGNGAARRHKIAHGVLANSAQTHFNMGVVKEGEGNLDGALAEYREAIRLEPDCADAQYNMGNIYFRIGALQAAIKCYQAAVGVNPRLARGYNNIGVAYYQLGQEHKALVAWLHALEAHPRLTSALENLRNFGPKQLA